VEGEAAKFRPAKGHGGISNQYFKGSRVKAVVGAGRPVAGTRRHEAIT
jgi:hypothetical protein